MEGLTPLEIDETLWERVFTVAPLVLIGTREPDGGHDLAPKHRVVQLSGAHFGFVCTERHATHRNAVRERAFTVSWPTPRQIVMTAAAAAPRCEDGEKRTMRAVPTIPATAVPGVLVSGASLMLECELERVITGFGDDELIVGKVVAAHADPAALRGREHSDAETVHAKPMLCYLHPSQFTTVDRSTGFPFPKGFER